jgi:site-specific DNA-methyltransferase (adenine-specific)
MTGPYYADDKVTLWHGDCRENTAWLEADVLVTDPPYGIGWKRGSGTGPRSLAGLADPGHAGIANDEDTSARDEVLATWGVRPGLVFGSFYVPPPALACQWLVFRKWGNSGIVGSTTGWRRDAEPIFVTGTWPKRNARWSSVVSATGGVGNVHAPQRKYDHPHAKPVNVMEELIDACPPGTIADPFAGSGSTLVAARNLGRRAIGVELEERYCEVIARRLAQDCLDFGSVS